MERSRNLSKCRKKNLPPTQGRSTRAARRVEGVSTAARLDFPQGAPYSRSAVSSPFLEVPESAWVASNPKAFAIRDNYPVTPGHTLVIPHREVETWFDATPAEKHSLMSLVEEVKTQLDAEFHPDGYNIGFNTGAAAGQTVFHLHIHVIPRYEGDMADPRGGVRHVIPSKGNYLVWDED